MLASAIDILRINEDDKLLISKKMAHSKGTQSIYRKIVDDSLQNKIEKNDLAKLELIEKGYTKINNKTKYNTDDERRKAILETKRKYYYQKKLKREQLNNN